MSGVTLFVDESGRFEPGKGYWPWGMRLVGGAAVPGGAEEAEASCREVLAAVLQAAGIPWWSGEVHGRDFTVVERLTGRLRAMDDAPAEWRGLAERAESGDARATRRLRDAGGLWLTGVRRALGPALAGCGARVLLVAESGSPGAGTIPGSHPFRRMIGALLGHSVMWAATVWDADSLDWVVAHRPGLEAHTLPIEPWRRALDARPSTRAGGVRLAEPVIVQAQERAGLQVADLIVHAIGPGAYQDRRVTDTARLRRTRIRVSRELEMELGAPVWVVEHDALELAHEVCALMGADSDARRDQAWAALKERSPKRPPDGVYPAAIDWAQTDVAGALGVR